MNGVAWTALEEEYVLFAIRAWKKGISFSDCIIAINRKLPDRTMNAIESKFKRMAKV